MSSLSDKQTRIFLWHIPRSISTCFEKCLSFVDGVQVWHEAYALAFHTELMGLLSESKNGTPFSTTVNTFTDAMMALRGQPNEFSDGRFQPVEEFTYPWIKSKLEEEEPGKKYILIKDPVYSIYNHMDALPNVPSRHTFLIRHPYRSMVSRRKMDMHMVAYEGDPNDFMLTEGFSNTYFKEDYMRLLWKHVKETGQDPNPIIVDAEDLMHYPEKILQKYLRALGIPYRESYTTWDASEESIKTWKGGLEWTVIGKRLGVFDRAFGSSRFLPKSHVMPKREELTLDITGIIDRIMPGYQEMYEQRLKPE